MTHNPRFSKSVVVAMLALAIVMGSAVGAAAAAKSRGAAARAQESTRPVPPPAGARPATLYEIYARAFPDLASPLGHNGTVAVPNIQSETSIAVAGSLVVIGFNDFRGFDLDPVSICGTVFSSDGGQTFTDGGTLPAPAGACVCGDPVLAVHEPAAGPAVFYASSIYLPPTGGVSVAIHRSTDGGATWEGPFEVTSATSTTDRQEDKEWITVDPETGRLFLTWTRFPSSGSSQLRFTYSDDGGETWSPSVQLGTSGQGTQVVADPAGDNVYVAWRTITGSKEEITFVRSTNNGESWGGASNLSPSFNPTLPAWGFDRFNSLPSIAVNPEDGGIELVYTASEDGTPNKDFGDVYYRRSTDAGSHWSSPVALNPFAGADRPQIFPTVAADTSGRIDVFWYDESAGSGVSDLTDVFYAFSEDLGATWSSPVPVTSEPFHNEAGNNYGAPHQGDYIDAVAIGAAYGGVAWFGDPSPLGTWPDPLAAVVVNPVERAALRVRPGTETFVDFGCNADDGVLSAGEAAELTLPLENFGRLALDGIRGVLTALTPGVAIPVAIQSYPSLAPGASAASAPFVIQLDPAFDCGSDVRLQLDVEAAGVAPTFVTFALPTGVVVDQEVLLAEDFDTVTAPDLPTGWSLSNECSTCDPNDWVTTTATPASPPNAAFASDVTFTSFSRLLAPVVQVPDTLPLLEVTFDVQYDLEVDDARTAFDGTGFTYVVDQDGPSRFATADAIEFEPRYEHYIVRASGNGRGDRSGWSGISGGYLSARIVIPDMGGHSIRPQFDLTTDSDTGEQGVWIDNVVIKGMALGCGACTPAVSVDTAPLATGFALAGPNPFHDRTWLRYALPAAGPVTIDVFALDGRRVRRLINGWQEAGDHTVRLDRAGAGERRLEPGVYWVRFEAAGRASTIKVVALD